jgi:hypothetical protein
MQDAVCPHPLWLNSKPLGEYRASVATTDLSESSQATANNFVRWLRGHFDPGSRMAPYRIVPDRLKKLHSSARQD